MGMKDQIVQTEVKVNLNRTSSNHHNKKKAKVMIANNLVQTVIVGVIILKTCQNLKPNKMMMHQVKVKKSLMTMQVKAHKASGLRKVMKKRSITD